MSQTKPNDTRQAVIDAATTLFGQHGFRGASVREICTRAGASANAITYHFGSKESLYHHILDSFASLQLEHAKTLAADPRSIEEFEVRFELFYEQLLDAYIENRETILIFFRQFEQLVGNDRHDGVIGEMVKTSDAIAAFIRRAMALGFVKPDVDPDIVAGLLVDRLLNQARFVGAHDVLFSTSTLDPEYRAHWVRATLGIVFNGIRGTG
jgi:AcrR family transcriptional regulator